MTRLPKIARLLLLPLGVLYGTAMWLRSALYESGVLRSRRLPGTVISVGNLTVGGTGKTPMVLWIAERLAAEGHCPAILTRGYGGLGKAEVTAAPDEAALLRYRLDGRAQFGIGKDRYRNGLALSKNGAQWFILDDGFQHLKLNRDANILLLDATNPFGGCAVLPAGNLREPRSAVARADIVVITRISHSPILERGVRRLTRAPIFYAQAKLDAVVRVRSMVEESAEDEYRQYRFFAFCGIGNSSAFFNDLMRWGLAVTGRRSFADHHRYSGAELIELEEAARSAGANAFICTEKDVFNLPPSLSVALPIYACRIRFVLNDPNAFWTAVQAAIARNQPVTQT